MESYNRDEDAQRTPQDKAKLIVQALIATWLITGLALHLAAVGLIGLTVIVLATAFTGVTEEHALGKAFQEALPFTALLTVFFSVVAVIIDQQLFKPVIQWVLAAEPEDQLALFYLANGLLSMVSDNVFVGTVYINEVKTALINGAISREHFELLAVAINTGTNLPSVATPNGQAAFLFMLTSALAPLLRLSMGAWCGWRCPIPWCWGWWVSSPWNAARAAHRLVLSGWLVGARQRHATARPPCIDHEGPCGPFPFGPALL
jgi:NhaB family Na+:H+ antiporter